MLSSRRKTMSATNILHHGCTDPQVERLIEKLEETCERVSRDQAISVMSKDPTGTGATYIPMRIREIVKETLSSVRREDNSLVRENVLLQKELQRAKTENKELGTKNNIEPLEQEVGELKAHNANLRKTLEEKDANYSLHLRAYQDGKQEQEAIIQTLQSQVEEYEFQCNELTIELESLPQKVGPTELECSGRSLEDELVRIRNDSQICAENHRKELKKAADKLEEQQKKVAKLAVSNQTLRQQLEESQDTNSRLSEDVEQLTVGWRESQERLKEREEQWKSSLKRENLSSLTSHQLSLVLARREASQLKKTISALGTSVKRDLSITQRELALGCNQLKAFIQEETGKLSQDNDRLAASLEAKQQKCCELANELAELKIDYEVLSAKHELTRAELKKKVQKANTSLTDTQSSCLQQTKAIGSLEASNTDLATKRAHLDHMLHDAQLSNSSLEREVKVLKSGITEMVQLLSGPPSHSKPGRVISGKGRQQDPAMVPEVKLFDTPCDVDRVREWGVGVVRHEVTSRDNAIQLLKSELATVQLTVDEQAKRMSELEEEVGAHSSTGKVTRRELDTCNELLAELNKNKLELETQLEQAISQRKGLERQFAQSSARVDALVHDKDKTGTNTSSLEEANRRLRFEVEQAKQELQLVQIDLTNKQNGTRMLELQLKNVEKEAEQLRDRIAQLEAIKLGQEKEMAEQVLSIDTLKMEKSTLQRELKHSQESEATSVGTLYEVQAVNKELEQEKRQLVKSLQKVTDKRVKLDEENVYLEKMKMSNEDELEKLKDEHSYLSEQVDDLDKSLGETESSRMSVQQERDQLKHEVAVLNDSVGKCKQALAEVQIQRGKLHNRIAVMAKEKGDLITGKVELSAQVVKLQENFQMSKERIASLHIIKDRLESKVNDLEKKLENSEISVRSLEEEKFLLQQEKHDLQVQKDELAQDKDEEISMLIKQTNIEVQHEKMLSKTQGATLQSALQTQTDASQREISTLKQTHADEVSSLVQQHDELVGQMREELVVFAKVHDAEMVRYQKDKETAASRSDKERELNNDRVTKLQKMLDDKSDEMVQQQRQSNNMAKEQRAQLDVSSLNANRLETELVASEKRLWDLQNKLDEVTKKANEQIESLKSELDIVSRTLTKLEASNDDAQMTIKGLENQNAALERQGLDTQRQLDATFEEKEQLATQCHSLERRLQSMNIELSGLNETARNLQDQLSRTDDDLAAASKDATSTHQTLSCIEQAHSKLVSEHVLLQSSLTSSEKDNTRLNIDLKNARDKMDELTKAKDALTGKLSELENKYKISTEKCQLKEDEVTSIRQRATNLEKEKYKLLCDFSKVKDETKMQGKRDEAKISENELTISNLKSLKDNLEDELSSLLTALETSQANGLDKDTKLTSISEQASTLSSQLEQSDSQLQDIQQRHAQILGVLEGTLGVKPSDNSDVFSPSAPTTTVSFSLATSRPESGFGDSISSPLQSLGDSFDEDDHSAVPSKLSSTKIDPTMIRDAILELQKKVMVAERTKHEALASAAKLNKVVARLEEEKISLEARLKTLRSSLISLQTSFDSVSKQRDQAEMSSKMQATSITEHEKDKKDLQQVVVELKKQLKTDRAVKKESESKLKEFASTQVSLELDRNKFETKTKQLELQRKELEEEIVKVKTKLSHIESAHIKKDVEMLRLQQKLVTSQHLQLQTEEQLESLKEANKSLGSSYQLSQESEKLLLENIKQLESKLVQAQSDKKMLERKISNIQDALDLVKKGKDTLDQDFRLLTEDQLQTETERLQLREKVQELNLSLSDQEVSKVELSTQLQFTVMKLQEEEGSKQMIECRLSNLVRENLDMSAHLRQLESDLYTAKNEKLIANELCGSLEAELAHMKSSLHELRDEHRKLQSEYQDTAMQNTRLDAIITDQKRQKLEVNHSLVDSSRQNVELMRTMREMEKSMATRGREHQQKLQVMASQVNESQGKMRIHESKWSGREDGHQKTIKKLESKVGQLESKLSSTRKKKVAFLEKAQEHDKTIYDLRSTVQESITALATGIAHIPPASERESIKLNPSVSSHRWSPSPTSSASQSPSRYSYAYSYTPSPSKISAAEPAVLLTSTPRK